MKKYITKFSQTQACEVDIDAICKDWNEDFTIHSWMYVGEKEYQIVISGKTKSKYTSKFKISKEQAELIIKKCALVEVTHPLYNSASSFLKRAFVELEVRRLTGIKEEKERELNIISRQLHLLDLAL